MYNSLLFGLVCFLSNKSSCKSFFQLLPISAEGSTLDLIIIGCGPAGLSLAAESAKKGLQVGLIGPDLPFTNNYGVWEDEFKGKYSIIFSYIGKFSSLLEYELVFIV